jgi:hypothetical protein
MKKALYSSETSVLARATRRNIPEDAILQVFLWSSNVYLDNLRWSNNFVLTSGLHLTRQGGTLFYIVGRCRSPNRKPNVLKPTANGSSKWQLHEPQHTALIAHAYNDAEINHRQARCFIKSNFPIPFNSLFSITFPRAHIFQTINL